MEFCSTKVRKPFTGAHHMPEVITRKKHLFYTTTLPVGTSAIGQAHCLSLLRSSWSARAHLLWELCGSQVLFYLSREIYHVLVKSIVQLSKPFNGSRIALIQVQIRASPDTTISDLFFCGRNVSSPATVSYRVDAVCRLSPKPCKPRCCSGWRNWPWRGQPPSLNSLIGATPRLH